MPVFSPELFVTTLGLIAVVVCVSALLSGVVDKSGLPQVAVFLGLGAVLGPYGLNVVHVGVDSPILRVVATLGLVLVLFTDAVSLNISQLRKNGFLAFLVLGPGTFASAVLVAAAAYWLFQLSLPFAAMLGAALASTDPVLLRSVLRRPELSPPVRQALRMESGLNDAVLLPIVLIAIATATRPASFSAPEIARLILNMVVLSPAAGIVVALAAIGSLELVRRRIGVRRDYESIYSLGIAFASFAAAEAVHGSGFIAAFAAGLTIASLDVELCDCFLEYGETTAEMALLFAFVLFGVSLIWSGLGAVTWPVILFVVLVLLARPAAFLPALIPARIRTADRAMIAWFGPRGLSTLLLILLPVFAPVPGSERLLTISCLVVLVSVALHGFSPMFIFRQRRVPAAASAAMVSSSVELPAQQACEACDEPSVTTSAAPQLPADEQYIEVAELKRMNEAGSPAVLVDARSVRSFGDSDELLEGAVRLSPESSVADANRLALPKDSVLAIFCA